MCLSLLNILLPPPSPTPPTPQDAQKAIPKGTLLAILITSITYLIMAWLSAIIVIRYAPGQATDFFGARTVTMNNSNDTTMFVNISFSESSNLACGETAYNLTEVFPACDFSQCNCTNSTVCDDIYSCLPTVTCLYGDKSINTFYELCSTGFLGLIGRQSCEFGTLNNFQVHTKSYKQHMQMYKITK